MNEVSERVANQLLYELKIEDISSDGCQNIVKISDEFLLDMHRNSFNRQDGLDLFRYMCKHLQGENIHIPQIKSITPIYLRYIRHEKEQNPEISTNKLARILGKDTDTIRKFLRRLDDFKD
jgi:hypothetical protein